MHLDKHRAISYCAFKRCHDLIPELRDDARYRTVFYPLWMGNWLTDMSQASAFFSFLPENNPVSLEPTHCNFLERCMGHQEIGRARRAQQDQKTDYYHNRKNGAYVLPTIFSTDNNFKERWERLFSSLWEDEWSSAQEAGEFSKKMGEMADSLALDAPNDASGSPAVTTGKAEEIGVYYPLDHFDVTDQNIYFVQKERWGTREELELDEYKNQGFMTTTAHAALEYAQQDWLKKAFTATQAADQETTRQNRLADHQSLKILGHGLHILQDFYSHSNYIELLLICMAEKDLLNPYWNNRIHHEVHQDKIGTFNAFVLCKKHSADQYGTGEETPVVTGRFDPIDTVHTLLELAIDSIHHHDNDHEKPHHASTTNERLYNIIFSTFSDIDIVKKTKKPFDTYQAFSNQIDKMQAAVTHFFLDYLVTPAVENIFKDQKQVTDTYLLLKNAALDNGRTLQKYRKAGEMLFHQHTIENHLRKTVTKAEQAGKIILPHHALLAKDHDKGNDAVKLSYKLSCALAAEASTEVLVKYFQGANFRELEPLLARRYVHPRFHREQCAATGSLNKTIRKLEGKWFQYAVQNPKNGQSILGFDIN